MKIDIETLRKTKGIGQKTLDRIIRQHYIDNEIKAFESRYIPSNVYTINKEINLWQGDCLELMNHIPDKSVDMILADLPYGTTYCSWDEIIPFKPLWSHYKRIIKDNGAIVLFGRQPFTSHLICSNIEMFKQTWVWDKVINTNFMNAKKMHTQGFEDIVVFYKELPTYNPQMESGAPYKDKRSTQHRTSTEALGSRAKYVVQDNKGVRYPRGIIRVSARNNNPLHPTQKPVKLLEYLIKTYTNEGMLVLDNTMGSGSTGVACKNLNRRFIGIELNDEYFNIAKERIYNHEEGDCNEN